MFKHLLRHGATRGSRSPISSLARSGQPARWGQFARRAPAGATALAVGIAGAAYSLTTTTASCVPTTRAGTAGTATQPPPDTIQAIGTATEDEAHPFQCLVCQDFYEAADIVTCLRVCVHVVCETCFAGLDARSCVGCRREWPVSLWTDRNLRVPLATRDPSNDHVNLVPADGATPSTLENDRQVALKPKNWRLNCATGAGGRLKAFRAAPPIRSLGGHPGPTPQRAVAPAERF